MDKIEFRAVIKHFWIAGKTATEIRNILQEVHGASTPSFSTISFWIIRPLRRRMNLTRTSKRKIKVSSIRKVMNLRSNGTSLGPNSSDTNNVPNVDDDESLALPSTSTGYRGQQSTSSLFRIAEVDSDDDQSVSSRPLSPRNQNDNQSIPPNLISIVPTPINGSRDSLGDSLRMDPPEPRSNYSPLPENRARSSLRRIRRNGRPSVQQSDDSSESPTPKDALGRVISPVDRLSAQYGRQRVAPGGGHAGQRGGHQPGGRQQLARLARPHGPRGPRPRAGDVSDDPDYQAVKFRQRVKKARRNYRNHMDSDSN
ncbi:hypothetical protein ACJJTC_001356 [Scirpophaga incertulas]